MTVWIHREKTRGWSKCKWTGTSLSESPSTPEIFTHPQKMVWKQRACIHGQLWRRKHSVCETGQGKSRLSYRAKLKMRARVGCREVSVSSWSEQDDEAVECWSPLYFIWPSDQYTLLWLSNFIPSSTFDVGSADLIGSCFESADPNLVQIYLNWFYHPVMRDNQGQ